MFSKIRGQFIKFYFTGKVCEGDVRGGDLRSPGPGVRPSIREKRLSSKPQTRSCSLEKKKSVTAYIYI